MHVEMQVIERDMRFSISAIGAAILCSLMSAAAPATDWYVATDGSSSNIGSIDSPWSIEHALFSNPPPPEIQPGNTIWLRGGTYNTAAGYCRLLGTSSNPIKIRNYPDERVIVDLGASKWNRITMQEGGHVWLCGFEIMSSSPWRYSPTDVWHGSMADYPDRGMCIDLQAPAIKMINMSVHDCSNIGIGMWEGCPGGELNGCLIYYNGCDANDRGHGHGIYTEQVSETAATDIIKDCIIFNNYYLGIQCYGVSYIDNYEMSGNICFHNGSVSQTNYGDGGGLYCPDQILVGGTSDVGDNIYLHDNYTYGSSSLGGNGFSIGYYFGQTLNSPTVTNNYAASAGGSYYLKPVEGTLTMTGNFWYGSVSTYGDITQYSGNTYGSFPPSSGVVTFVIPSSYQWETYTPDISGHPGRGNICVYNWDDVSSVNVDLSSILANGDIYEIRDVQDFYGSPIAAGAYNGERISLTLPGSSSPVTAGYGGSTVERDGKIHFRQPSHTERQFNAFVVLRTGGGTTGIRSTASTMQSWNATIITAFDIRGRKLGERKIGSSDMRAGGIAAFAHRCGVYLLRIKQKKGSAAIRLCIIGK